MHLLRTGKLHLNIPSNSRTISNEMEFYTVGLAYRWWNAETTENKWQSLKLNAPLDYTAVCLSISSSLIQLLQSLTYLDYNFQGLSSLQVQAITDLPIFKGTVLSAVDAQKVAYNHS